MRLDSAVFVWRVLVALLVLGAASHGKGGPDWKEGHHYFLIVPAQPTSVSQGRVEVTEVFSYGCPICNRFLPTMRRLKSSLPANAVVNYVPASFNDAEDWPMFQRAYITAQVLGVADRTHEAMFAAVWESGELGIIDPLKQGLKAQLPTIEDAARFYHRVAGVSEAEFVAAANSMGVNTRIGHADDLTVRYGVGGTPTIIVNGKYRLDRSSAGDDEGVIELVNWLVAKETR